MYEFVTKQKISRQEPFCNAGKGASNKTAGWSRTAMQFHDGAHLESNFYVILFNYIF